MNQFIGYSALPVAIEEIAYKVIGCAIEVHRHLGPGYLESIYERAMQLELDVQGLKYEAEKAIFVRYRGFDIPGQRVDLVVGGHVVVELKTVRRLKNIHPAQVMSYLETMELRLGLIINFHSIAAPERHPKSDSLGEDTEKDFFVPFSFVPFVAFVVVRDRGTITARLFRRGTPGSRAPSALHSSARGSPPRQRQRP